MQRIRILVLLLFCAAIGFSQTGLATITGTVTDSTGAVVANAPVSVKNVENGQAYEASSSGTGNYTVSQLPIGDYSLTVMVTGFKTYTHTKFHLAAGQTLGEDVALQVGASSDSVTISAEASLLQTESSELAGNFTIKQLDDLPLLTVGATNDGVRDYFAASRLLPGVQYCDSATCPGGGSGNAVTVTVINGTPSNSLSTRLDGAVMNPTSSRLGGATMETQSSTEAVQEVNIVTSSFAPEFGAGLGAVVNVVTKSGTNDLHGTAYDYLVNTALNASQPYTGLNNPIHQNDFGFTVGGPVWIPKLYNGRNKTFFFFSFEEFLQNLLNTTTPATVPTPAYRNGDFSNLITVENRLVSSGSGPYTDPLGRTIQSGTIFDPTTERLVNGSLVRDPFPGNKIPVTRFDPVAAKILALVPGPLGTTAAQAGSNYQGTYNGSRRSYVPSIKVDHNLGSKLHAAFYFQKTSTSTPRTGTGADSLPDNITTSGTSGNAARTYRFNLDHTVSPTLLIHYTLGWNDSDFLLGPEDFSNQQQTVGLPGAISAGRGLALIATGVTGNIAEGGMNNLGPQYDQHFWERRPSFVTSATYVRGAHTYKIGGEIRQMKYPNFNFTYTAGEYAFATYSGGLTGAGVSGTLATVGNVSNYTTQTSLNGSTISSGFAGFGLASFELGGAQNIGINAPINLRTENYQSAVYLQDSWKVNRKLTLDYGLRWDYGTYQREQYGRYGDLSTSLPNPSAAGRAGALIYEANCNCQFAHNYPFAIGPRLGAAYQVDDKTSLRGGVGVVYGSLDGSAALGSSTASAVASQPAFGQIAGLLQNGIPSNVQAAWPTLNNPAAGQAPGAVVAAPTLLDPNAGRPARLLQWNITAQRTIGRDIVVEAGYVGNRGVWETVLPPAGQAALSPANVLSQSTLAALGVPSSAFSNVTLSSAFNTTISALTAPQKQALAAVGLTQFLPYANFPQSQTVRQALVPFPQYTGNINPSGAPLGKNWYDGLQMKFTKRFSHGLTANANYTYSKTLNLTGTPDPFNRNLGKNLSPFDVPHQLRISAQYEVPRFQWKSKVLSYIVSGWGTGWYLNYQSASLVGLPTSAGTAPISNILGYGPGPAQLIPGMSPWSVDWTDYSGKHHTDPLDINCHCFDPTKTVVLNPAAFTNVPNGQFAANESSIRSFRGFRIPVENANFSRTFRVKEHYTLQVRAEFTNIFNRTQFAVPTGQTNVINLGNFTVAPTQFTSGPNKGLYSGGFGTIVPVAGTVGQRAGTLVARFSF
jgi:hypothetical protein